MTNDEFLGTLSEILGDLLGSDGVTLALTTRREDVPDWDSLMYVNFIAMVEIKFGVKFKVSEIESFKTVGDVVAGVQARLTAK
jgi:acyl carrier protein